MNATDSEESHFIPEKPCQRCNKTRPWGERSELGQRAPFPVQGILASEQVGGPALVGLLGFPFDASWGHCLPEAMGSACMELWW